MRPSVLHDPMNQTHLQMLKDRLSGAVADEFPRAYDPIRADALVRTLADVVRAMDQGVIAARDVEEVFAGFRIPGFSFGLWLSEMVEQGIYRESLLSRAA